MPDHVNWDAIPDPPESERRPERPAIVVDPQVPIFERGYHLPLLTGTTRQIAWGRLIRQQMLTEAFPELMAFTQPLPPDHAKAVFGEFGTLRNNIIAKDWIDLRQYRGNAAALLGSLLKTAQERQAAEREKLARCQRSKANQALSKRAKAFDAKHQLPPITGLSPSQISFGRRCRYQTLEQRPPEEIQGSKNADTSAGYWIGEWERIERSREEAQEIETPEKM